MKLGFLATLTELEKRNSGVAEGYRMQRQCGISSKAHDLDLELSDRRIGNVAHNLLD